MRIAVLTTPHSCEDNAVAQHEPENLDALFAASSYCWPLMGKEYEAIKQYVSTMAQIPWMGGNKRKRETKQRKKDA